MRRSMQARVAWVPLLILLLLSGWRDAALLMRSPVAAGIDGYYYVLQIDALKNNHRLYFPTRTPLVLYYLAVIGYFTKDSVAAVKVGSVSLHFLLCLGIFALIASSTGNVWVGALAGALAGVLGLHLYMIAEFINVLGALTFLVWAGWFAVRWAQTRRPTWIGLGVLLLAAAVFSHQVAVAVLLIVAISLFLFLGLVSSRSQGRFSLAALIAAVTIYFAPAIAKAQAVVDIPDRLRTELTAIPHWPINYNYLPETLMLAVLAPLALLLLLGPMRLRARSVGGTIVGLVAIWSLLATLNPFLNETNGWMGIVGRIRGLAYIQVALILPGMIWLVHSGWPKAMFYVLAVLPAFAILSASSPLPFGLRSEYLVRRERLAQQLPHFSNQVGDDSLIIASHGDQFLVTAILGIASQQLAPESNSHPTVYWLLETPNRETPMIESVVVAEHQTSRTILVADGALRLYLLSATDVEKRTLVSFNRQLMMAYNRGGPGNPFG
ncbi:MAG: hypothetical protein ACREA9_15750 [Pyrinomonadaceae bacterium]